MTVGAVSREHHPNKNDESEYDREVGIGGRIQLPIRIVWRGFKKDLQANQEHHQHAHRLQNGPQGRQLSAFLIVR